jgi:hypothetical protein
MILRNKYRLSSVLDNRNSINNNNNLHINNNKKILLTRS